MHHPVRANENLPLRHVPSGDVFVPRRRSSEPQSVFQRVRGVFRRTPLEERLQVIAGRAVLRVFAEDDGTLEVQVTIANLSRRALTIDRFHCEQWLWNGAVLPSVEPHFRGIGARVRGRDFTDCWLTFQLGAGAIRRIRGATVPAANRYSSVEARVEILGRLWFARRKVPMWIHLAPPNAEVVTSWGA